MIFDMPNCGGCRTCEIACSFHHRGEFKPMISSIRILEKTNGPGFLVVLVEHGDEVRVACDLCKGLEIPLCVEYCEEKEELEKMLKELAKKKESMEEVKNTSKI